MSIEFQIKRGRAVIKGTAEKLEYSSPVLPKKSEGEWAEFTEIPIENLLLKNCKFEININDMNKVQ